MMQHEKSPAVRHAMVQAINATQRFLVLRQLVSQALFNVLVTWLAEAEADEQVGSALLYATPS